MKVKKKDIIELRILQAQMHWILNKEIQDKILYLRKKEFIGANKPAHFLAWQVKKKRQKKIIAEIRIQNKVISDQVWIKKGFRDFCVNLYHSRDNNGGKIKHYLQKIKTDKMPERFKILLNEKILTEEIFEAIAAAKPGKAPGPDGFTSKFLKVFRDQLVLYLGKIMNDILRGVICHLPGGKLLLYWYPKRG